MRFLISLITFLILQSVQAQLQSPEDLLKRSSTDANQLHEVILELQYNLTKLTTKDQFRSYFNILPTLSEQSQTHALDSIHPGAVKNLGEQMVAYGVRWLDITKEDLSVIKNHLKWMDAATAHRYVYNAEELILKSLPQEAILTAQNIDAFVTQATQIYQKEAYISQAYRNLLSELAIQQIQTIPIENQKETLFWIQKINNQESLATYIYTLLEKTYLISPLTRQNLEYLLEYTLAIKTLLAKDIFPVSARTYYSLGEVVLEIIDKSMLFLWPLDPKQSEAAIFILSVTQASGLADRLLASSPRSIPDMDSATTNYAEALMYQLSILGAQEKAGEFSNLFYSTVPSAIRGFQKFEGTYKVEDKKSHTKWLISFFRYESDAYMVVLYNMKTKKSHTLTDVSYDYPSDIFLATENQINAKASSFFAKIQFLENKKIIVQIPDKKEAWIFLDGQQESAFAPPPTAAVIAEPTLQNEYTGEIQKKNGNKLKINISLAKSNDQYLAQLFLSDGTQLTLTGFFSWTDSCLYFTSNPYSGEQLVHLRIDTQLLKGTILFSSSKDLLPVVIN